VDPRTIEISRLDAGRDYLEAVERLGLRPTAMFWAFDRTLEQFVLVLTTPLYDYAGPYQLSQLLVEAYRRSGTPREIDPFLVRLHSPAHTIIREIAKFIPFGTTVEGAATPIAAADLIVESRWIYRFEEPAALKSVEAARRWDRFVRNVDRLAA
jgi:hypothetical protein